MDSTSWSQTRSTKSTTTTSRRPLKTDTFALKTDVFAFASRSKAKAKPRRPTSACSSTKTVPVRERIWTDIEPGAQFHQAYPVAKRQNTLLRHGQSPREEDGAIEFWRLKRWSSERIWALSILVWWNVEEENGKKRRQQEKISILYWLVRTRNSFSPSPSRSFRTQSHWFHTSGQCVDSGQFLRVHLSYWMCNQFTLHQESRIDSGRTKFKQGETDGYSLWMWIPWIRSTEIRMSLIWPNHVLHRTSRRSRKETKYGCIGSIYSLLNEKDSSSIK